VNVSYELGEDEQVAFNLWLGDIQLLKKPGVRVFSAIYSSLALSIGFFLLYNGFAQGRFINVALGMLCTALGALMLPIPSFQRQWRTQVIQQNIRRNAKMLQKYLGTRTASIEATGLRVVGPTGERLLLWDGLTHAETDTLDIFHLAPADAIVIPRRVFTSGDHRQSFLSAIEAAKTGTTAPTQSQTQTQTWWTQSGVGEHEETQNNTSKS
jgi:hypothetical protein